MELFGSSRSRVGRNHALICSDSFVRAPRPGWTRTQGVVLIAPALGAHFTMYLAFMEAGGTSAPAPPGIERFVFLLHGLLDVRSNDRTTALAPNSCAFVPAGEHLSLEAAEPSRLVIFEKKYVPLSGIAGPTARLAQVDADLAVPFQGDSSARLQTLLPDEPAFDLAVNVFTYQPGAALPQVEVHVMEHGLLMLAGQGVYRLGDAWYPVQAGDVIWMGPFCPQWFVAMGKEPASYLYYKDVHRDPLEPAP
jgi:(S)-ureidoglycine aminohydrolase